MRDLKAWFDELWNDPELVQDVKADVLRYLAQLQCDQAPEFVYFKTLFHIFERYLSDTAHAKADLEATSLLESGVWNRLFRVPAGWCKGAINKLLAYNGCILADSVGLGKTYEALAVIKYFELKNDGYSCYARRSCVTTGLCTRRMTISTRSSATASAIKCCRIPTSAVTAACRRHQPRHPELGQLRPGGHRRIPQLPEQHPGPVRRRRQAHSQEPLPATNEDIIACRCEDQGPDALGHARQQHP